MKKGKPGFLRASSTPGSNHGFVAETPSIWACFLFERLTKNIPDRTARPPRIWGNANDSPASGMASNEVSTN